MRLWVSLALLACLALARTGQAQNRWLVLRSDEKATISLDTTRISTDSGWHAVWMQWQWSAPRSITGRDGKKLSYIRTIDQTDLDCTRKRSRTRRVTFYSRDGDVQASETLDYPTWSDPIPDSYGEISLNAGCRVATGAFYRDLVDWQTEWNRQRTLREAYCQDQPDARYKKPCATLRSNNVTMTAFDAAIRQLNSLIGLPPLGLMPVP